MEEGVLRLTYEEPQHAITVQIYYMKGEVSEIYMSKNPLYGHYIQQYE